MRTCDDFKITRSAWRLFNAAASALNGRWMNLHIRPRFHQVIDGVPTPVLGGRHGGKIGDNPQPKRRVQNVVQGRIDSEFFESVWEVHAKCMAMFGPQVEETFLELHKARRGVEIAIEMLIRHLDDAPTTPDPSGDLWQQLRADLCGAEGALSKEGDRIGRQLTEFRDGMEALCRPVLERGIGKKAN